MAVMTGGIVIGKLLDGPGPGGVAAGRATDEEARDCRAAASPSVGLDRA